MHLIIQGLFALFLLLLCFAVLAVIGLIRGKGKSTRSVKKLGFLHADPSTEYRRSIAISKAKGNGATTTEAGETDGTCNQSGQQFAVLNFTGDVRASGKDGFSLLVNEVLTNKERFAGAIVVVNSPGGGVSEYGQMYAEMLRLKKAGVDLTVCVDTYAASGGYLMSLPATRIIAAPFAMVGSVGVVTEFLNFHKLLKGLGVEPMTITAGNMKRTVTQFSDPDDQEKKDAYQSKLVAIHDQFRSVVTLHRPQVDVALLNGDHWTAQESVERNMKLVDEIATSSEHLFKVQQDNDLVRISLKKSAFGNGLLNKLFARALEAGMTAINERFDRAL